MADEFEAQAKLSGADEFVSDAKKIKEAIDDAGKAGDTSGFDKFAKSADEAGSASKEASGDIEKAGKAAKNSGDDASSGAGGWDKIKGAIGNVATTAAGFAIGSGLTKLPGFLTDAAQSAADDEAATLRLQQAVANLGGDYDATMGSVNNAIANGQKLAFTDDDIRDSFIKLSAATGDGDEAMRRLAIAQDLARGAGIPLTQASTLLGKVTDENISVFSRMGITFDKNATQADVLAAVQKKFSGQAETYAKSTAGQWEQARISMSETVEGIGYALLPIMSEIGKAFAEYGPVIGEFITGIAQGFSEEVVPAISQFVQFVKTEVVPALLELWGPFVEKVQMVAGFITGTLIPAFMAVGSAIVNNLSGPLSTLFDLMGGLEGTAKAYGIVALAILVPAFIAWAVSAGAAAVATIAATLPLIAIGAAIAALVVGVALLMNNWDKIVERFPIVGEIVDGVKEGMQSFADWLTGSFAPAALSAFESISNTVKENWPTIKEIVVGAIRAIGAAIEAVWPVAVAIVTAAMDGIKSAATAVWPTILQLVQTTMAGIELAMAIWDKLVPIVKTALGTIETVVRAVWPAIQVVISAAMTAIMGTMSAAWTAITAAASGAWSIMEGAVRGGLMVIEGIFTAITGLITGDWQQMWDGLKTIVSGVWVAISGAVTGGMTIIQGAISAGGTLIVTAFETMWELIKGLVPIAFAAIVSLVSAGISAVAGLAGEMLSAGQSLMGSMRDGLEEIWDAISGWIQTLPGKAKDTLIAGVSFLYEAGKELMVQVRDGMISAFFDLIAWVATVPGKIISGFGDIVSQMYNLGKEAVQGFINGVGAIGGSLFDIGKGLAGDFLSGVSGGLLSFSPSKKMYQQGEWAVRGFVDGIYAGRPVIRRAGSELAQEFIAGSDIVVISGAPENAGEEIASGLGDGMHTIIVRDIASNTNTDLTGVVTNAGITVKIPAVAAGTEIANGLGDGMHQVIVGNLATGLESDLTIVVTDVGNTVTIPAEDAGETIGNSINTGLHKIIVGNLATDTANGLTVVVTDVGDVVTIPANGAGQTIGHGFLDGLNTVVGPQSTDTMIQNMLNGLDSGSADLEAVWADIVDAMKTITDDSATSAGASYAQRWFKSMQDGIENGTVSLKTAVEIMTGVLANAYNPFNPMVASPQPQDWYAYWAALAADKNAVWKTALPTTGQNGNPLYRTGQPPFETPEAVPLAELVANALADSVFSSKEIEKLRTNGYQDIAHILSEANAGRATMNDVLTLRQAKLDTLAEYVLGMLAGVTPGTTGGNGYNAGLSSLQSISYAPLPPTPVSGGGFNIDLSQSTFTGTPQENGAAVESVVRRVLREEQSGLITLGVR